MELQAGFSLVTAPRFHPRRPWADRLRLNDGIEREGTHVHPRPDWRPPTADELALLVQEHPGRESSSQPISARGNPETARSRDHRESCLDPREAGLLAIPTRLREAWWAGAECGATLTEQDASYQRFVTAVLEFLRFKRLPLPARCEADVMASRPDLRGNRLDPRTGELNGLGFSAPGPLRTVGVINLGDEATHVVLLNLPARVMRALLAREGAPDAWSLVPSELAARFFEARPAYPLTRVRLDPGEGVWFPRADVVHDGWVGDKRDVDVVLSIRGEMEETAAGGEPAGGMGDTMGISTEPMREPPPAAPPGAWP
jgi:hypothetical protein